MKPTVGRIVIYTLDTGRNAGAQRPAVVVRVWSEDTVQLQVFTDEANDGLPGVVWKTSVKKSETDESEFGRWHWPKKETT